MHWWYFRMIYTDNESYTPRIILCLLHIIIYPIMYNLLYISNINPRYLCIYILLHGVCKCSGLLGRATHTHIPTSGSGCCCVVSNWTPHAVTFSDSRSEVCWEAESTGGLSEPASLVTVASGNPLYPTPGKEDYSLPIAYCNSSIANLKCCITLSLFIKTIVRLFVNQGTNFTCMVHGFD